MAKRHKIEKYSLILHSELKLLEESQPMEKVCANEEQNGNNLCLLTPLYLFSFSAHRQLRYYRVNTILLFVYIFNIFLYCNKLEFRPVYIVESLEMRIVRNDVFGIPADGTVDKLIVIGVCLN